MNLKKRRQLRRQAFQNQDCKCHYCQLRMWIEDPQALARELGIPARLAKYLQCTAEHLIAQQDHGTDSPGNVVAACLWCNQARHRGRQTCAPDPATYKARVAKLVPQGKFHPVASSLRARSAAPAQA